VTGSGSRGRVLGIDLGDVRIGLARSDPLGITAQPLGILEISGDKQILREIRRIVSEQEISTVVIGLPLLLSGEEGERARAAREFASRLEKSLHGVDVLLWDERLSTVQAERVMISGNVRRKKRKEKIDSIAASLILQSYLDAEGTGAE
jgi:putative Holliday junction resolvase